MASPRFDKYGGPCIVVDFGTAITFDVISARGEYLGGAIAPGIGISADALFARAARLFRVEIKDPGKVIGTNTVAHMQAGLFYGTIDLVDGMLSPHRKRNWASEDESDRHRRTGRTDRAAAPSISSTSTNFSRSMGCASSGSATSTERAAAQKKTSARPAD